MINLPDVQCRASSWWQPWSHGWLGRCPGHPSGWGRPWFRDAESYFLNVNVIPDIPQTIWRWTPVDQCFKAMILDIANDMLSAKLAINIVLLVCNKGHALILPYVYKEISCLLQWSSYLLRTCDAIWIMRGFLLFVFSEYQFMFSAKFVLA